MDNNSVNTAKYIFLCLSTTSELESSAIVTLETAPTSTINPVATDLPNSQIYQTRNF